MFFAVEGEGFLFSSASGYSKGLAVLLGQKKKDKPMRVSPWNQYQLMDQESDIGQLDSSKNRLFRRCASFVCFSCTVAGLHASSPVNRVPAEEETKLETLVEDHPTDFNINDMNKSSLRSSLKKPSKSKTASGNNENDSLSQTKRRKVQWTDACGSELVEIREFEPSEVSESVDELGVSRGNCSCVIM